MFKQAEKNMAEKQETLIVSLPTPSRFTSSDFQLLFVNVSYQNAHKLLICLQCYWGVGGQGDLNWGRWKGDEAGPPQERNRLIISQEFSTETCSSENISSVQPKKSHVKKKLPLMTDSPRKATILKNQPPNKPKALQIKKQSYCPTFRAAHLANAQWN